MIVALENAGRFLPSFNFKIKAERLRDFLLRSQDWLVDNILGPDIEADLETLVEEGREDPHERLRLVAGRAVFELAYLTAAAEMDLQLSEAGFVVQSNDQMSPASQQRVDRLVMSLNERLCWDCDYLVNYLMEHSVSQAIVDDYDKYADWRGTEQFANLTRAFVPTMRILKESCRAMPVTQWKDFLERQAAMAHTLHSTVAQYVSDAQIATLLELYRDNELGTAHHKAVQIIRRAVGAETEGLHDEAVRFAIEARSYMLKHESDFPDFVDSDRYTLPDIDFGEGAVANML